MIDPHPTDDLPCRDLVEVVTAYLDGALADGDRARFEAHLAACEDCVRYVDQIRVTIGGTRRSAGQAAPVSPELRDGVRRAFRGWAH